MPDQLQTPVKSPEVAPPQQTGAGVEGASNQGSTVQPRGNAAANEQLAATGEGGSAGLANYEASLGSFLGEPLYKAVHDNVTWEKLGPAASKAVDSALKALVDQLGSIENVTADPKALDTLAKLLQDKLGPHADKLLEKYGKELTGKLAKWTEAHPRTILMVALLAAAGAVIANVDLPTLKQKFKLGKAANLNLEAQLGKIRSLALEKVRAELTLTSAPLSAMVQVGEKDGKLSGEGQLKYGKDGKQLTLDGKFDDKGMTVVGLKGELQVSDDTTIKGGVSKTRDQNPIGTVEVITKDGKITRTTDYKYDANTGVFTLGKSAMYQDDQYSLKGGTSAGTDGSGSTGFDLSAKQGNWSGSLGASHNIEKGAYGLTESDKLSMGLKFQRSDLVAKLDAALSTKAGEKSTVSGSINKNWESGFKAGGDFSARLDSPELLEVGAFYGFKDPNAFKSFLLDYRYKSETSENAFSLTVENTLADVRFRWKETMRWGGRDGSALDTSLQAAKFLDKDTAVIAGFEHTQNFGTGKGSFTPQVGVQYKGVPVLVGYDMERKAVKIGISIPF